MVSRRHRPHDGPRFLELSPELLKFRTRDGLSIVSENFVRLRSTWSLNDDRASARWSSWRLEPGIHPSQPVSRAEGGFASALAPWAGEGALIAQEAWVAGAVLWLLRSTTPAHEQTRLEEEGRVGIKLGPPG